MLTLSKLVRDAPKKKEGIFWEFFPKGGGGSSQFPKLFYIYRFIFCMPKHGSFGGGPVFPKVKTGSFLGGHLFPKLLKSKIDQKVNIFVKTKNAPKGLKCKINQTFFFENTGSQKGGRGGGPTLGKNSQKIPFFFVGSVPNYLCGGECNNLDLSFTTERSVCHLNIHTGLDRSQSLFYFVPQEKGLIWRPCWGWKNMGESNFHYKNGPPQTKMHSNVWEHMPRVQEHLAELIFVHFSGRGNWFSEGHLSVWTSCCKMHQAALPI